MSKNKNSTGAVVTTFMSMMNRIKLAEITVGKRVKRPSCQAFNDFDALTSKTRILK